MKTLNTLAFYLFLILLLLSMTLPLNAQTGCNTGVTLTTQAEVDAFSFTGVFDGSIVIGGDQFNPTDITNLDALSGITGITNALSIVNNPMLTDISGLENLTFLGANNCQSQRLSIWLNPLLADLSPLSGMTISPLSRSVDLRGMPEVTSLSSLSSLTRCRELRIFGLDKLTNLDGLENLTDVTFINVLSNPLLTNIDALANVTESWNPANESISVDLSDNPMLINLNGLAGLSLVTTIEVTNCDALQDLSGMGNLLNINGKFDLQDNDGITSLAGLNPDLEIGTLLVLRDNTQLSSCAYEPICDQISQGGQFGQVSISGNANGCATVAEVATDCEAECGENVVETMTTQEEVDAFAADYPGCRNFLGEIIIDEPQSRGGSAAITNLDALSNLRQIGVLRIHNAPSLTNLSGLMLLDSINGDLDIRNTAIVNLSSLSNLQKLGGRLDIAFNPVLESVTSFSGVDLIVNNAVIRFNPLLNDLSGFSNLVTIGDVLDIVGNPSLPDLTDFSSLRFSFDGLNIDNNDLLTSLAGLETLENINAGLRILNNDLLTDISTLDNLDQATIIATSNGAPGTAALIIRDNPLLSNCAIETVCTFLDGSGTAVDIQGNAVNCESQTVVENNCLALPITLQSFTANPADKAVLLAWQTAAEENTQNFTLERSNDGGRTFLPIGSVAALDRREGAEYTFLDENLPPSGGQLYYRLIARDFDGAQEAFGPVAVNIAGEEEKLQVIPNPSSASSSVQILGAAAGAELRIFAVDGRHVATLKATYDSGTNFLLPALKPGVYIIRTTTGGAESKVTRVVIR